MTSYYLFTLGVPTLLVVGILWAMRGKRYHE